MHRVAHTNNTRIYGIWQLPTSMDSDKEKFLALTGEKKNLTIYIYIYLIFNSNNGRGGFEPWAFSLEIPGGANWIFQINGAKGFWHIVVATQGKVIEDELQIKPMFA